MAEKRMFTKKVTDDENFVNLSSSAQALYLHLAMSADDDGFTSQVSVSMFKAHASVQDMEALLNKRYIYQFDDGVIVIKHWRMANALRKDRYTPTTFREDLKKLGIKENGSYTMVAERLPVGCQLVAVDKNSLDKNSLDKNKDSDEPKRKRFTPPTIDEVKAYCEERHNTVDAEKFIDYYESNGWMVGKNKMKDWKAAVRTWEKNSYGSPKVQKAVEIPVPDYIQRQIEDMKRLGRIMSDERKGFVMKNGKKTRWCKYALKHAEKGEK